MDTDEEEETLLLCLLLHHHRCRKAKRRPRQVWVREIHQRRTEQGEYHQLLQEMRLHDSDSHFRYLKMSKATFDQLLAKVGPLLVRRRYSSVVRPSISPGERLALTLRYLATGNSQISLFFSFRVGAATVCQIVREACIVIWNVLMEEYVMAPATEDDWKSISAQFSQLWNFPNCLGAIDGKHVVIQAPDRSGSTYYNYKGTYSIVLLAVCDAHYRFILVDVGDSGRHSDGGVFSNSAFGQATELGSLSLPVSRPLPGTSTEAPFVFVGDEAFPLRTNMLRPYPGRGLDERTAVFNYRLSRARRVIENTFGILAARWRIFRRPIIAAPDNAVIFTKAAIALHNYLRTNESSVYCPPGFTDAEDGAGHLLRGNWRHEVDDGGLSRIGQIGGNRSSRSAAEVRDMYRDYFMTPEGEVTWQYHHVNRKDY